MKKQILLSVALFSLIAAVASAADIQSPADGKPAAAASAAEPATKGAAATYTIADLYQKGAELSGKKVVIHGRAVKVTNGIMGKTWAHIQDGTGEKSKGTDDVICVAAKPDVEVGDEVTVTGVVKINDESRYRVVIEEAVISK